MTKENNNELEFLDVQVKRKNNILLTSVYRKKTFTGCYLNFQSTCSLKRKSNQKFVSSCTLDLFSRVATQ